MSFVQQWLSLEQAELPLASRVHLLVLFHLEGPQAVHSEAPPPHEPKHREGECLGDLV